jgi:L-gulonolactone oxidase
LSFPRPGATLALDFRNRGGDTLGLFERLDAIVAEAGGRLYPAKDGRMPAALFKAGYPAWSAWTQQRDPAIQSEFVRRILQ